MRINLIPIVAIILLSCNSANRSNLLQVKDFNEKAKISNSRIIDVRTPEEYQSGHIGGAINIDYKAADFESRIAGLEKDQTYLVYCLSGHRSGEAMEKMLALGYKNTYGLDGGIEAWQSADMPLETASTTLKESVVPDSANPKDPDFKTAIFGDKLVFVDFNATWCGPCRKMQPYVDMIKEERPDDAIVFSIDTDQQPQLAQEYQIVNLPTVMLMKKGVVLYRQEGYHDQQSLNDLVTKYK